MNPHQNILYINIRFLTIFIVITGLNLYPQNNQWDYYFVDFAASSIVAVGDTVYAGTFGGLFITNTNTLESTYINETNSDFKGYEVTSIAKGKNNELWVTVDYEGLNHFDGHKWHNFNTQNSNIHSEFLDNVVVDNENNVWFKSKIWNENTESYSHLCMYDGIEFHFYKNISNVRSIAIDTLNNVWVVTGWSPSKIGRLVGDSLMYLEHFSLNGGDVKGIMFDKSNKLFISNGGTITYDGEKWEYFDKGGDYQMNSLGEIFITDDAYGIEKIYKLSDQEWEEYLLYTQPEINNLAGETGGIGKLAFDKNDNLIAEVSTRYYEYPGNPTVVYLYGLAIYKEGIWNVVSLTNTNMQNIHPKEIKIDNNNNKWIGCSDGLIKYDGTAWYMYNNYNFVSGVAPSRNSNIELESDNILWIVSGWVNGGIIKYQDNYFYSMTTSNSDIPTNSILDIAIDQNDNIWLGSEANGLIKYNGQVFTQFDVDPNNPLNNVLFKIWLDKQNNVWGTSWDDEEKYIIVKFNVITEEFEYFPPSITELPLYFQANSMGEDKDGTIYFGTEHSYGHGKLIKYSNNSWTVLDNKNVGMPTWPVISIAIDSSGNKWFGTADDGLYKYDNVNWLHYTAQNSPIPDNVIKDIEVDQSNNLWMVFNNGILVYNESGIVNVEHNKSKQTPKRFSLPQNYPNPFNPTTTISYKLPLDVRRETKDVKLVVFDVLGKEVAILVNKEQPAGNYEVEFDGSELTSGIYFYRLQAGDFLETKKMILLK